MTQASTRTFTSPRFGSVRTAGTPEKPLFCLHDLSMMIGLKKTVKNEKGRFKEGDFCYLDIAPKAKGGKGQGMLFVTISGMRDALVNSRSKAGNLVFQWISQEVLPVLTSKRPEASPGPKPSGATYTFSQMAKELGMRFPDKLTGELLRRGILKGCSGHEYLIADALKDEGLVSRRVYANNAYPPITVWTEKGREYLMILFGKRVTPPDTAEKPRKPVSDDVPREVGKIPSPKTETRPEPKKSGGFSPEDFLSVIYKFDDVTEAANRLLGGLSDSGCIMHLDCLNVAFESSKEALLDVMKDIVTLYDSRSVGADLERKKADEKASPARADRRRGRPRKAETAGAAASRASL